VTKRGSITTGTGASFHEKNLSERGGGERQNARGVSGCQQTGTGNFEKRREGMNRDGKKAGLEELLWWATATLKRRRRRENSRGERTKGGAERFPLKDRSGDARTSKLGGGGAKSSRFMKNFEGAKKEREDLGGGGGSVRKGNNCAEPKTRYHGQANLKKGGEMKTSC